MLKDFKELLHLSATPPSILYPYPVLALLVFSFSGATDILLLFKTIIISFIFSAGINLWNHVNDIEEDIQAGRKTILAKNKRIRKTTVFLSTILYLTTFVLTYLWLKDKLGLLAFVLVAFVTWIYSDKICLGKIIPRWKNHYLTEVLTYIIAIPFFTLLLWSLITKISIESIALSVTLTFFMLSVTFLKDIKDSSGDRMANLKTLGVVFSPSTLLKASIILIGFYYASVFLFSVYDLLCRLCVVTILASVGLIYSLNYFVKNGWYIDLSAVKPIKLFIYSNIVSLIILLVTSFIQIQGVLKFQ